MSYINSTATKMAVFFKLLENKSNANLSFHIMKPNCLIYNRYMIKYINENT